MQVYPNRFSLQHDSPLKPFYMVFGDEPQQKLECLEIIRKTAQKQGFDERQSLVVDNQFSWDTLVEASQTMSLFSNKQIIELELPTGKPGAEGSKILSSIAQQPNTDVLIVIHGGKVGKDVQNTKWFKAIDMHAIYIPCYPLEGNALHQWVGQQMQQAGMQHDPQIAQLLVDYCEGNLLAAKQEIQKLILLYPQGNPTIKEVEQAVVDQSRFTVFHLIDVILSGDSQKAVKMLYRLESEGVEPNIVLWALTREWQTLEALLFEQQHTNNINWNRHRIWKNRQGLYQSALRRLSPQNLQQIQVKLSEFDRAIKQSQVLRPYVELCHLCLLFIPFALENIALDYALLEQ
ncbi:DNA polymerase III subunit delta [Paraglaciecola aquimarina]|uniref:DNA polymerase III subunit delta n=1 Tax=Paraglaciecola aquimarina TaxID=1235557 RepID=A0ABU3SZP2_9ALTE|nr:DNA polymerase III subunit delta [Paraglaciecola aquimarina]MDU0355460.1 DNA polymerase III subunit delta [Paraglaciecola aquimarina]